MLVVFLKLLIPLSVLYWFYLYVFKPETDYVYIVFPTLIVALAVAGFLLGINTQKGWSGFHSFVGKSVGFITLSLLMWALGMIVSVYYSLTNQEIPYPGLPDFFWILIDPFYTVALIMMIRFSGATSNIKKTWGYLVLIVIPLLSLYVNYKVFFAGDGLFEALDLAVLFDLFYSFGSIAVMTLIVVTTVLSLNKLGGKMKAAMYLLFVGLFTQYVGDVTYSILLSQGNQYDGNLSDFIYFLSIAFVTVGLASLNTDKLNGNVENVEGNVS